MKKILSIGIALIAVLTLVSAPAFAGPNCGVDKASATTAASKTCSASDKAACAEKFGVSPEECEKICKDLGDNYQLTHISVKGMTCGSCENAVTTALKGVNGVKKVIKVSHKDAMALVAVDKGYENTLALTNAVANKGFQAEIIPAVAKTTTVGSASKSCTSKEKAACAKACASKATAAKATTISSDKKACGGH